jgi:nucleoid-associated protein YgaU
VGIFDQIKSAFSSGDDVRESTAVEKAQQNPKLATEAAPAKATSAPSTNTYTVQSGDTLFKIAEELYGDGDEYEKIFDANREILESPDRIEPGQKLSIPK